MWRHRTTDVLKESSKGLLGGVTITGLTLWVFVLHMNTKVFETAALIWQEICLTVWEPQLRFMGT